MDQQKRLALELALENRLRADLDALAVRPYAYYKEAALRRIAARPGALGRRLSFLRAGAIAVAVLFVLAAALTLLNLRGPSPTATAPSPAPTPVGFTLPESCSYVGGPVVTTVEGTTFRTTTWEFDCGAVPDFGAIEKLSPTFVQQGWTFCRQGEGRGLWAKGPTQIQVGQSARSYPVLSQMPRTSDCP